MNQNLELSFIKVMKDKRMDRNLELSFIKAMKDKVNGPELESVLHQGNEGQNGSTKITKCLSSKQ